MKLYYTYHGFILKISIRRHKDNRLGFIVKKLFFCVKIIHKEFILLN